MKKLLTWLVVLTLAFGLVSCGETSDATEETPFEKPESYATVLLVTINPQYKLYLDEAGDVLAVEPVNDDAKSAMQNQALEGKLDDVLEKLAEKTEDAGFIREGATVELRIVETKQEKSDAENILSVAKESAGKAFEKLDVAVEIKTSIAQDVINDGEQDGGETEGDTDVSDTTAPDGEGEESGDDGNGEGDTESQPSEPEHTHTFADATCTKPKTCSCGETDGDPLGHDYKNGKCKACGAADPDYKLTELAVKNGSWQAKYIQDGKYYAFRLVLVGETGVGVSIGDPLSEMEPEVQEDIRANKNEEGYKDSYVVYKDKEFWVARGSSAPLSPMSQSGDTVTVTVVDESGAQLVLTRTAENTLKVKSCTQAFKDIVEDIPVGTKLTFQSK